MLATNLAFNPTESGYPHPLDSDDGWGGGTHKWHLTDGLHSYNHWANGLAFTDGGVRQATIDFGSAQTFDKVVIWWHGILETPETTTLERFDGSQWVPIPAQRMYGTYHEDGQNSGYSDSDEYFFDSAVSGSKVRLSFDNTGNAINGSPMGHGWIYEFEVFDPEVDPFEVTNTSDSGSGSLRQAIENANSIPGTDTITFNIPGSGVHTISPTSALPSINEPVIIDGYTQPGASPNTLAVGNDATLLIELDGTNAGPTASGLYLYNAYDSTIKGLVINRFSQYGIRVEEVGQDKGGNVIEGNFIGTDANGTVDLGNGYTGVYLNHGHGNVVGGTSPAARNVIAGNESGITITNTYSGLVQGNYVGTDKNGTGDLRNDTAGVYLGMASGVLIGGIEGGAANVIAFNGGTGVIVNQVSVVNSIRRNSIHTNGGLGIDLGNDENVTPNDFQDLDNGPNNLQNFPTLTVGFSSTFTVIRGSFNSTPNTTFTVDFYYSDTADPTGHGEGQNYLGSRPVTTDANGDAKISFRMTSGIPVGSIASATATDPAGNTSEFGPSIVIGQGPAPIPPPPGRWSTSALSLQSAQGIPASAPSRQVSDLIDAATYESIAPMTTSMAHRGPSLVGATEWLDLAMSDALGLDLVV